LSRNCAGHVPATWHRRSQTFRGTYFCEEETEVNSFHHSSGLVFRVSKPGSQALWQKQSAQTSRNRREGYKPKKAAGDNATRQKPISTAMISDLLILEYPFSLCPFYLHKKGGGQVEMKHPGSQSALLLFGHAFQGDFPRPVHTRSAPCGSSCHLISFHLHFNVN
jgi:hypothetical protein